MTTSGPPRSYEPRVPAAPFQQFLKEQGELHGEAELATAIDRSVRWIYRFREGRQETARGGRANKHAVTFQITSFPRAAVEDALDHFSPGLFYDLYPEYAGERDIILEPDAWCPFCQQMVTPVEGLCPWCVCDHGHVFREVGLSDQGFACIACQIEERRAGNRRCEAKRKARRRAEREAA